MVGSHAKIVSVGFFTYRVQRYLNNIEVMCAGVKSLSIRSVYHHNSEAHLYVYFKFVTFVDLYSIMSVGGHQGIFESNVQYPTILWHGYKLG